MSSDDYDPRSKIQMEAMEITNNSDSSNEPMHETSSSEEYSPSNTNMTPAVVKITNIMKTSTMKNPTTLRVAKNEWHLHQLNTHRASLRTLKEPQTIMHKVRKVVIAAITLNLQASKTL